MGVQNLWTLLAPVGRQVEIESLAGQVLAVDASIWLTQFVKAMRDDEGNMIRNAHLLGTLYRVAKLLFYGVRPVFVFDGQTPEIKKRTTARRRKRQEQQTANLRHTAQRLLLNRLTQQRQEVSGRSSARGFIIVSVDCWWSNACGRFLWIGAGTEGAEQFGVDSCCCTGFYAAESSRCQEDGGDAERGEHRVY